MSLFSRFFKKPAKATDDPVFGHITYEYGLWVYIPKPEATGFMVSVDASESGPAQSQRDFYLTICANLPEFEGRARDFMRSHADPDIDVSQLSVYSIEIGSDEDCRRQDFVLEMCDKEAHLVHRISFSGKNAVDYGC